MLTFILQTFNRSLTWWPKGNSNQNKKKCSYIDNFIHGHSDYYWTVCCVTSHLYKTLAGHFVPNCPLMYGSGGGWVREYERAGLHNTRPLSRTHTCHCVIHHVDLLMYARLMNSTLMNGSIKHAEPRASTQI